MNSAEGKLTWGGEQELVVVAGGREANSCSVEYGQINLRAKSHRGRQIRHVGKEGGLQNVPSNETERVGRLHKKAEIERLLGTKNKKMAPPKKAKMITDEIVNADCWPADLGELERKLKALLHKQLGRKEKKEMSVGTARGEGYGHLCGQDAAEDGENERKTHHDAHADNALSIQLFCSFILEVCRKKERVGRARFQNYLHSHCQERQELADESARLGGTA